MPRLEVDIAFMSPGQGAEISKSWARDPSSRKVVDETQKQLPHGPDMQELLSANPEDRPINALNAHLLLAMVMGMARERLSFHLAKISYAFSGHSAGLPNILGISEFYNNGVPGLVASMERRSRILVAQQEIEPGEMDALVWKGVNNFKTMVDWVLEQNGYLRQQGKPESIWLACYNYATDKETQVVITSRKGTIGQIKEKFPENVKRFPLKIALGAHSPLMAPATGEYKKYLQNELDRGRISSPAEHGTIYVSDHIMPDEAGPLISGNAQEIVNDLSRFDIPVTFQNTIVAMTEQLGVRTFIEIGSDVLCKMLKKMGINDTFSVLTPQDLDALETKLANGLS